MKKFVNKYVAMALGLLLASATFDVAVYAAPKSGGAKAQKKTPAQHLDSSGIFKDTLEKNAPGVDSALSMDDFNKAKSAVAGQFKKIPKADKKTHKAAYASALRYLTSRLSPADKKAYVASIKAKKAAKKAAKAKKGKK